MVCGDLTVFVSKERVQPSACDGVQPQIGVFHSILRKEEFHGFDEFGA